MITTTIPELRARLAREGHVVFRGAYNLTLGVLRANPGTLDRCDDLFYALFEDEAATWQLRTWACTADPGRPAVTAPRRREGVAIIATGQHRRSYQVGLHKGVDPALESFLDVDTPEVLARLAAAESRLRGRPG